MCEDDWGSVASKLMKTPGLKGQVTLLQAAKQAKLVWDCNKVSRNVIRMCILLSTAPCRSMLALIHTVRRHWAARTQLAWILQADILYVHFSTSFHSQYFCICVKSLRCITGARAHTHIWYKYVCGRGVIILHHCIMV